MERKRNLRRKRLRTRKRLNWTPILVLLLTTNLLFACFHSKITAIRNINLDGVRHSERLRLNRIADEIKGIPALKVDPRVVESPFMNESRVLNADFRRNIFGVARLVIQYRKPVASIVDSKQTYLDENGVIFIDLEESRSFPSILLQSKIKVSVMSLSGVINFKQIADLAQITREKLPESLTGGKPVEIEVQETGGVCLNISSGVVELGSCEQLPVKIESLKKALMVNPNLFRDNSSINLMVPDRLDATPRKKESG
jgi:hypothetical protein